MFLLSETMTQFVNNNVSAGDVVRASDHNTQGANIADVINGNLDNDNINASAAIVGSKLADKSINITTKASAWDGWLDPNETWTYASATTFTVSGDVTTKYPVGTKLKLTNSSTKYFYVTTTSYSAPNTTVTISGGSDYTLSNTTISANYYSYATTPQGFPQWFNFTPSWTSNGTAPAIGNGTLDGRFSMSGRTVTAQIRWAAGGTTTFGTGSYFFSMPVESVATNTQIASGQMPLGQGRGTDNSASFSMFIFPEWESTTTVQLVYYTSFTGASASAITNGLPWTWAQNDSMHLQITYEAKS